MAMEKEKSKKSLPPFLKKAGQFYRLAGLYLLKFLNRYYMPIIMVVITTLAMVARALVVSYPTNDMVGYVLNSWIGGIRNVGFSNFYKVDSDYSPLYMFMLAIISLFPSGEKVTINNYTFFMNDMVYVKTVYYVFTIALAFGVFLLVKHLTESFNKAGIAYCITIMLPTVFINSAMWGNSDVVYATFLIYCFYFLIAGKDRWAYIFFGLALANKLQAIFIFPFIVYLILNRKIKLYRALWVPLVLLISFLPAYFCGASFGEPFKFFSSQVTGYKKLTLGCANIWQFIYYKGDIINTHAPWIGIALIGVTFVGIYLRKIDLSKKETLFKVGFVFIMSTIFFLPHMHERYFYVIDVLVIVYALIDKKKIAFVPLMQLSSIIAYYHYITGHYFIDRWGEDSVHIAAAINLFILGFAFYELLKIDTTHEPKDEAASLDEEIKRIKEESQEDK